MKNLENWTDEELKARIEILEVGWRELRQEIGMVVSELESLDAEVDKRKQV